MSTVSDLIKNHTLKAAATPETAYRLSVIDSEGFLWRLLEYLKKCGEDGHSVSFKIDDQSFGFDGDGADKIVTLRKDVVTPD